MTVVGHWRGISEATVEELRAKGCQVERVAGDDGAQTKEIFDALSREGRRFVTFEESC